MFIFVSLVVNWAMLHKKTFETINPFSSDNFVHGISETRKSRTKECESDGTRLKHRKECRSKNSNAGSFGRQGVDVGMVLTDWGVDLIYVAQSSSKRSNKTAAP
jgi:hypothetical protein